MIEKIQVKGKKPDYVKALLHCTQDTIYYLDKLCSNFASNSVYEL